MFLCEEFAVLGMLNITLKNFHTQELHSFAYLYSTLKKKKCNTIANLIKTGIVLSLHSYLFIDHYNTHVSFFSWEHDFLIS